MSLQRHTDLEDTDYCFYWRTFTSQSSYNYSKTNQLIKNFKISPSENHRIAHKQKAISQIANELKQVIKKEIFENYTFIPIPPSNPENHPEYDDRLIQVLKQVQQTTDLDFRNIIFQNHPILPVHKAPSNQRPTLKELLNFYEINTSSYSCIPKKIIVFDDVLTKGTHFKAVQKILQNHFPQIPIVGLFVALSIKKAITEIIRS